MVLKSGAVCGVRCDGKKKLARLVRSSSSSGLRKNNPRSRWELPPLPNAPRTPHLAPPARYRSRILRIPSATALTRARGAAERDGRLPPSYAFRAFSLLCRLGAY
ncbi:uncharacterized protein [Maniola hyperantus]|uniref:uncharacterized protein n=1 Tax=Aphantopus hyperantus TaxID=2795564 RepID=UPI0037479E65